MKRARWPIALVFAAMPLAVGMALHPSPESPAQTAASPRAKVTNPHGPIAIACQNCHTYTSWKPIRTLPEFNHDQTGYPLRGGHQQVPCARCHTSPVFKNVGKSCADCHADIHRRQMGANCESCHSVKGWQVNLKEIRDHQNRFPLVGAHAMLTCDACHKNAAAGQFQGLSTACYSCHQADFKTPVIDHVSGGFPVTCESCHTMNTWFGARFDHLKFTGFALTGMHATLPCTACHLNNVFKGTPANCYACHNKEFDKSTNPPHVQLGLPHDCGSCHTTANWLNARFDHALYAHYPLTGKHAALACAQCHLNNNYTSTPTSCYSCHKTDFGKTTKPNHVAAGFPTDCSLCHTTGGWIPSSFDHTKVFPLVGAHAKVACSACHLNNNYTTLPRDCYSCHLTAFKNTTDPPHVQTQLPHTCDTCHNMNNWKNATFDHTLYGHYALTGMHAKLACAQCHLNGNYTATATNCYACHKTDFGKTTKPNHVTAGFPTDCSLCHTTAGWIPSSFDHAKAFPLLGAHAKVACAACHINNNYTTLPKDCYGCHQTNFNKTTDPPHLQLGLPHTCDTCHNLNNWQNALFDHTLYGHYALTGMHAKLACKQCHLNGNYTATSTLCYSCHQADFTKTTKPNHVAAGFPTDCSLCHSTGGWSPSSFDHAKVFPLVGAHATTACSACHLNNNYTTLPKDCYSCHLTAFKNTTDPPHVQTQLPHTCDTCHNMSNWKNATFNHTLYGHYTLTGMHAKLACAQCHLNGNYTSTSTNCYSCHKTDFTRTTNPNHVTAGFPTDCSICHSTAGWIPSSFDHSKGAFPLTGAHKTVSCSLCHVNGNYTTVPTDCYSCHKAKYLATTDPNHVKAGFPTTCATCHNTTSWVGAVFDHNKTPFPLTGAHKTVSCLKCHINNVFVGTPTDCYSCHKAQYIATTNPNHISAGFPTTCATCHTTTAWTGATFNHTWFNTRHGGANGVCATCHTNSANYALFTCTGCHTKTRTDSQHDGVSGYVYNSVNCYACHKNAGGGGGM